LKKDKDISKKIKESFENESFKAPDFNEIVNFYNVDIDHKLKSSLENLDFKAPKFSELFINSNTVLNNKIKQSFERERYVLPNSVWDNLQNKIDVKHTWNRLANNIQINTFSWKRLAFVASLLIITLLVPFKFANEKIGAFSFKDIVSLNKDNSLQIVNERQLVKTNVNQLNNIDKVILNNDKQINVSQQNTNIISHGLVGEEDIEIKNQEEKKLITVEPISFNLTPIHLYQPKKELIELIPNDNKMKKNKLTIGLFASVNSSLLNDKETRASFNSNNLTSFKPVISSSKGIVVDYWLNSKFSLSAYYLFRSTSKGKLAFYNDEGFYTIKTKEIDYSKYAVLLNYSFKIKQNKLNTRNIFGVGPYLGVNKESFIYQNDVLTTYNSNYKKYDYGFKLVLGKELIFNDIILGGGITSDIGLRNIIKLPNQYASNMNIGGYLNVKYKF